jgi:hypothetical protein
MYWRGVLGGPIPGGHEALDFVHDAVYRLISGAFTWNPESVNLFLFLAGVIRSDLSKLARSPENTRCTLLHPEKHSTLACEKPDPSGVNGVNRWDEWEIRSDRILSYLSDDQLIYQLSKAILETDESTVAPRQLAKRLGVTTKDIYNAKKRLRRRLERYCWRDPSLRRELEFLARHKLKRRACYQAMHKESKL